LKAPNTASASARPLAIAISYTNNHSVLWAIIHGFFSWLYVIYYVLFK
jgi:hypothetical protein